MPSEKINVGLALFVKEEDIQPADRLIQI